MLAALTLTSLLLTSLAGAPLQDSDVKIELFTPTEEESTAAAETTVGMRVALTEFVIAGDEVRAKPVADAGRADMLVRIVNVFDHGSDHRYNMEITPFVEGVFDLRNYLERRDGSALGDDVAEIRLLVDEVTDEAVPMPVSPEVPHPEGVGGYTNTVMVLGVLWAVGLLCLVFLGRGRKRRASHSATQRPVTLAERLHPLVLRAGRGELESQEQAELERLVLAHWRQKRGLSDASTADAMSALRRDEEAGPLLQKLEQWFHSPRSEDLSEAEVAELLAPYGGAPVPAIASGGSA